MFPAYAIVSIARVDVAVLPSSAHDLLTGHDQDMADVWLGATRAGARRMLTYEARRGPRRRCSGGARRE